jgi:hypothetical protein
MATDSVKNSVRGHISLWQVEDATGHKTLLGAQPNQIQYSWGFLAAKQLGYRPQPDRPNYHISAMYIEFENQADPETPIAVDTFSRDLGKAYYNTLAGDRDFLRIPIIIEPTAGIVAGYEALLPTEQQINKLTFFVQTAGLLGENGLPFSHTSGSKVYAAALVAAPTFSDKSKDVIFARTVFTEANQVTKEASSQIGITWEIAFE